MSKWIKTLFVLMICYCSFYAHFAVAKVYFSYLTIEKNISYKDCIDISKQAREKLFKDDFGEFVDENSYTYSDKAVIINVMCFEKKKLVFVSVSTQDTDPLDYLNVFETQFTNSTNREKGNNGSGRVINN
ncbi:hypothetical protein [Aliikangiella maris]|uniref:DUF4359 domain-containing protein n=2 Tax=Aliikangiella maris TaxID=3162458 RepID=A0ABV3MV72_9GAMM